MSGPELEARLAEITEACRESHPMVAGVLLGLRGSMIAGDAWLYEYFKAGCAVSAAYVQFATGDGETKQ